MTKHIVARTSDIPLGGNKVVGVEGRDIVVFHVNGEFFALLNRCPHAGAPLDKAACVARLTSPEPGVYQRSRVGELLRCAWHGGEFDMRNGQSWFDPKRFKVRTYPVAVEDGETLAKGPYVAETFPVHVEDSYVVVEIKTAGVAPARSPYDSNFDGGRSEWKTAAAGGHDRCGPNVETVDAGRGGALDPRDHGALGDR